MISRLEIKDSIESIKSKIIHGNAQRYRRAIIAVFAGQAAFMITAWVFLGMLSSTISFSVGILRWLIGCASVVSVISLLIVLLKKNLHLATSFMAIFFSLLFIPTLLLTGGFISPFVIVYLLTMFLSIVMVDVIPPGIGRISSLIIIGTYVSVSLAQKAGFQLVIVPYVQPLLEDDCFFWLIFLTFSSCLSYGYFAVSSSSRNIQDTLTQLILTYRYVAKGTSLFISDNFFPDLLNALIKALQVRKTFLIEWGNARKTSQKSHSEGRIIVAGKDGIDKCAITISDEFKDVVAKAIYENNHSINSIRDVLDKYLTLGFTPLFNYWTPIYDSAGELVGVLGVADRKKKLAQEVLVSDIMQIFSSRVSAEISRRFEEQKRLQMQTLLAQGQKMQAIGQLSSSIAHDFNNMLNGIFGFASLISKNTDVDSSLRKYSEKIIQLGKNAGGLISQLLVYSRHSIANTSTVALNQIVEDCIEIITHTNKKRILIRKQIPEDIINIVGDMSMIQSAILNLLINAYDAMEIEDTLSIELCVKYITDQDIAEFISGNKVPEGNYSLVTVIDTGCGISEDKLARIFEPFYTTKGVGYGTGLGLAAVFGCMESHHGFISVDSVLGQGSTFILYFPIQDSVCCSSNSKEKPVVEQLIIGDLSKLAGEMENIESQENEKGFKVVLNSVEKEELNTNIISVSDEKSIDIIDKATDPGFSKSSIVESSIDQSYTGRKTVMLVDDEISILESLSEYLTDNNYNVLACDTGAAALEMFASKGSEIDAIVLDMVLPDISGRVVYESIYKTNPHLGVIIITGYSTTEDIEYVKMLGAKKILHKPFDFKNLDIILSDIVNKR